MQNKLTKLKNKLDARKYQKISIQTEVELPIYIFDLSEKIDADKLTQEIYEFRKQFPRSMNEYNKNTYVHAWHSDFATPSMTDILDKIIETKKEKITQIWNVNLEMIDTWINIYTRGNFAKRHKHGMHGFSTVYYPYVEENPTPIIFDGNGQDKHEIYPKKNMLIVFHSLVWHTVPIVNENTRISIASNFNVQFKINRDPLLYHEK